MLRIVVVLGLLVRPVVADTLTITTTTTPAGGPFAPKNVVVVWIEDSGGTFVKTIQRWAGTRVNYLLDWVAKSGQDTDAVSGATRLNHNTPLSITWDVKNRAGTVVPDGAYTIRMELADSDSTSPAQNHEGTFTFVKGPTGSMQQGLTNGGFINTTITFTSAASCGNGAVDPGETCDGNCPASCTPSADACMPVQLVGTAATCDAVCMTTAITTCVSGDGCCPMGCDESTDSDCGTVDNSVTGGCSTGSNGALAMLLVIGAIVIRRRRRWLAIHSGRTHDGVD